MKKRLFLPAIILLLGITYLALYPRSTPPAGRITIEMSVWGMPWENALYTDLYIPAFEKKYPHIKVKFHHFENYHYKILLSHAGGIAPDVMRQNITEASQYLNKGMNLPLDSFMDGPNGIDRNDFIPILWEPLTRNNKTYGIPQDINMVGLFYNKDLCDEVGLAYPDSSWTWKDLQEAAKRLTIDRDGDGHPEVLGFNMYWNGWGIRPFVYQAGGQLWNEDKTTVLINSPAGLEALQFMKGLMQSYTLSKANSERGGLGPDKFFEMGKVALFIDGSWRTPSIQKNAPDLSFGVSVLPHHKRAMTVSSSCYWAVSSQTKHPHEAWLLARFLSNTENLISYWQTLWVAPPARWSALRSPAFRQVTGLPGKIPGLSGEKEFREKCLWILEVLEQGWTTTEQVAPYLHELTDELDTGIDRVLLEDASIPATLHQVAKRINESIVRDRMMAIH